MAAYVQVSETTPVIGRTYYRPENWSVNDDVNGDGPKADDTSVTVKGQRDFRLSSLTARSKVTLLLCAMANLFSNAGFALSAPFYPQEAYNKGVSSSMIGVIFAVFQFVIFIASPVLGTFLTRIGAKFMFIAGIFLGGSCSILFGDALHRDQFAMPVSGSLGLAAFIIASFAIVSNEFPRHVGTVFGILETFSGVGTMVGPAIGGALYEVGGFRLPFFVVGSAVLVNGAFIFWTLPIPTDLSIDRKTSVFKMFQSPLVLVILINVVVAAVGISFLEPTFANHLRKFNLPTAYVGLLFVIAPGLYGLTAPAWGYFTDKTDIKSPLIIIGNLGISIGYFLVGPTPWLSFLPTQLWLVIAGLVLVGLSFGCTVVPTFKLLILGAFGVGFEDNLDTYGIVSGLFKTAFCFGAFIGPTMGGVLIDKVGFNQGISIVAVMHLTSMTVTLVYLLVVRWRNASQTLPAKKATRREG